MKVGAPTIIRILSRQAAVPPNVLNGTAITIQDLMPNASEMKDKELSDWLDTREHLGFKNMTETKATGLHHVDEGAVRTLALKYKSNKDNQLKCVDNTITRSCAFTGSFVILKCGHRVLYPNCPGRCSRYTHTFFARHPPHSSQTLLFSWLLCVCAGWTQAINTLGLCANPSEEQLKAENPTVQRTTRGASKHVRANQEVVKVMVFKVAFDKPAVIRSMTYDLLFNNMKSIVAKTAGNR